MRVQCFCFSVFVQCFHLGFWSGNLFLIAPFPDLCLLVPFHYPKLYHCTPFGRFTASKIIIFYYIYSVLVYHIIQISISKLGYLHMNLS